LLFPLAPSFNLIQHISLFLVYVLVYGEFNNDPYTKSGVCMPKIVVPLRDTKCMTAKPLEKDYTLFDGSGLFLLVKKNGTKSWRFKYKKPDGRAGLTALGDYPILSLVDARKKRDEYLTLLTKNIDPIEQSRQVKVAHIDTERTFEVAARAWHAAMQQKWSSGHSDLVLTRLEQNLFPVIGSRSVVDIKTRDLIATLLATQKRGTLDVASRMQQQLVSIFRFAVQRGLIEYNPAQELGGCLSPVRSTHRPALPLERLPELLQRIDGYNGRAMTRLAVLLTLHVFVRSSELRFARWKEFDLAAGLWTIPAEREAIPDVKYSTRGSKMKTPHLVPLSTQALALLAQLQGLSGELELVLPGDHRHWKPLSEGTVNKALTRMGYDSKVDVCGHGFRTMACSALNESGHFSRDAIERQMSHQERDGVRAAYIHKAEFIKERQRMMSWWSNYLDANRGGYVPPYDFHHGT
jgi:integrase